MIIATGAERRALDQGAAVMPDLKAWGFNPMEPGGRASRARLLPALAQLDTRPPQLGRDALLSQPGVPRGAPLEAGTQMAGCPPTLPLVPKIAGLADDANPIGYYFTDVPLLVK